GRIVRQVRLEQPQAADGRGGRTWMRMNIDDVFALQVVNVGAIWKQAVEQQEAQIRDAGLRKRRQTHETLHTHLPVHVSPATTIPAAKPGIVNFDPSPR